MGAMKRILFKAATAVALLGLPAVAFAAPLEGRWANPKRSVIVQVAQCGNAYCGTVIRASDKAKANARKGGTQNLIGTRILSGLKPAGNNRYKGKVFVPKRNIFASATVRQVGSNVMEVEGCVIGGLLCDEQRWTRVGG
jgi:uncharacterized protein (DUF2147 family)